MSEQKVPRTVEQRIVIKFFVGEKVPSAEIHHRLQQQYGEECLRSYRQAGFERKWVILWQEYEDISDVSKYRKLNTMNLVAFTPQ